MIKKIESLYLMYLDGNNLYEWAMSQKRPVNGFKWVKNLSKFNESFIKVIMKIVMENTFMKQMFSIQKICLIFRKIYYFYQKDRKSINVISLFATYQTKKNMLFTKEP